MQHTAPPLYHQYALHLLINGFQLYSIKPAELGQVTSKQIYTECILHTTSEPKVTDTFLQVNFRGDVLPRLSYSGLTAGQRHAVFDSVHGLIRNCARLFQQGRVGASGVSTVR